MNRIVLIGNGFDLAHGLPTSYTDFICNYWQLFSAKIFEGDRLNPHEDDLVQFKFIPSASAVTFSKSLFSPISSYKVLQERTRHFKDSHESMFGSDYGIGLKFPSVFFERINEKVNIQNWVDIENEYYTLLKNTGLENKKIYTNPVSLNCDLECIGRKLEGYLCDLQKDRIGKGIVNERIKSILYSPFRFKDISADGTNSFYQFLDSRIDSTSDPYNINPLVSKYGFSPLQEGRDIDLYMKAISDKSDKYEYHRKLVTEGKWDIHPYFLLPENIMFLSFNYTNTIDLYIDKKTEFEVNHVHGKLNDPDNPMIFGYGDELDEHYKKIENLNDNKYLKNIKSVHYLKTDNLRKLRSFIDSAPYQIIILGHSCGNSDRTLLNTLFEHKNCISIKPYFYEREDGTDDYINIIQNISRNFNDKTLMRDRVVNKSYCDPLPQN